MPSRIEDYALVGDCGTAALIGRDGSVDWLCWPRFDSHACFAAVLGSRDNGRWLLRPVQDRARVSRRYRPGTLILETRFETEEGAATVIDFMPLRRSHSHLVRIVRGERGRVAMCFELVLRFDYGSIVPWVTRLEERTLRAIAGPDMVLLRSAVDVRGEDLKTVGEFTVASGQTLPFTLTYAPSHLPAPEALVAAAALDDTCAQPPATSIRSRMCKSSTGMAGAIAGTTTAGMALASTGAVMPGVMGSVGVAAGAGMGGMAGIGASATSTASVAKAASTASVGSIANVAKAASAMNLGVSAAIKVASIENIVRLERAAAVSPAVAVSRAAVPSRAAAAPSGGGPSGY